MSINQCCAGYNEGASLLAERRPRPDAFELQPAADDHERSWQALEGDVGSAVHAEKRAFDATGHECSRKHFSPSMLIGCGYHQWICPVHGCTRQRDGMPGSRHGCGNDKTTGQQPANSGHRPLLDDKDVREVHGCSGLQRGDQQGGRAAFPVNVKEELPRALIVDEADVVIDGSA